MSVTPAPDIATQVLEHYEQVRTEAWNAAIQACIDAQPSTAEIPDEDAYQHGRFDGVMEYSTAIRLLRRVQKA